VNQVKETIHFALWSSPVIGTDDSVRIVKASYGELVRRTGFCKKTIQRAIPKLRDEGMVLVERPANRLRGSATMYRVLRPQRG
jgi:hypothetical protein